LPSPSKSPGERSAAIKPADLWPGHSRALAFWEKVVTSGLVFCAAITIFTTAGIILVLGAQSFEFFRLPAVSVTDFFFGTTLRPGADPPRFGIVPLLWGTFLVAAGSSSIALPIGLLSAIYLSEYAPSSGQKLPQAGARAAGGNSHDRVRLPGTAPGNPDAEAAARAVGLYRRDV
jgi:phosphate transport system permease protein